MPILGAARSLVKRVLQTAVLAPLGVGRPQDKDKLDAQYVSGHWDRLDAASELPHYAVIAGYVRELCKSPRILDVGCGHGRLLQLMNGVEYAHYLGMDISVDAIRRARELGAPRAEFVVGNFDEQLPDGPFDVVIYNESLYYAKRPSEALDRTLRCLAPDGLIVVSMWRTWKNNLLWPRFARRFDTLHRCVVENERDQCWEIRVLRKKR